MTGFAPVLWRTALQAAVPYGDYPGTPPPSVYQVTHGTALQAAERHVRHLSCEDGAWKLSEDVCGIRDDGTLMISCRLQDMCEYVRRKCQDGS